MDHRTRKYSSLTLYGRLLTEARPYWPHVLAFIDAMPRAPASVEVTPTLEDSLVPTAALED
jgi:hypothetical protein